MDATSIWKRWDGDHPKGKFHSGPMRSFHHDIPGSRSEWMMSTMAGIAPLEPGFAKAKIAPQPGGTITWCKAHDDSIRGRIATHWRKEDGNPFKLDVTIPPNMTAEVHMPAKDAGAVTECGQPVAKA